MKKHLLIIALLSSCLGLLQENYAKKASKKTVASEFSTKYQDIVAPSTVKELQNIVIDAARNNKKIALKGAGKSQGGQTFAQGAVTIDMKNFNKVVSFDPKLKQITIQTGMTWQELQRHLNPHRLAVKAMQSYSSFSIGGSLSVNVHGQDIHWPVLSSTVVSFTLPKSDGTINKVSRKEHPEEFYAALGGYGLMGIILDVNLELTDNVLLKRKTKTIKTKDYTKFFFENIKNDPDVALHSARLEISPMGLFDKGLFDKALTITYYKTTAKPKKLGKKLDKLKTYKDTDQDYLIFNILSNYDLAKAFRMPLESIVEGSITISRNNAMNATIDGLTTEDARSTYILQEYFLPPAKLNEFLAFLKRTVKSNKINLLNATLRYVAPTPNIMLSYSPGERIAIVLFISAKTTQDYYQKAGVWTRSLIDNVISLGGTYYLPYHLFATKEQLTKAYPRWTQFVKYKKQVDPQETFVNSLYLKYS